jgi:hypothetical protein
MLSGTIKTIDNIADAMEINVEVVPIAEELTFALFGST